MERALRHLPNVEAPEELPQIIAPSDDEGEVEMEVEVEQPQQQQQQQEEDENKEDEEQERLQEQPRIDHLRRGASDRPVRTPVHMSTVRRFAKPIPELPWVRRPTRSRGIILKRMGTPRKVRYGPEYKPPCHNFKCC